MFRADLFLYINIQNHFNFVVCFRGKSAYTYICKSKLDSTSDLLNIQNSYPTATDLFDKASSALGVHRVEYTKSNSCTPALHR